MASADQPGRRLRSHEDLRLRTGPTLTLGMRLSSRMSSHREARDLIVLETSGTPERFSALRSLPRRVTVGRRTSGTQPVNRRKRMENIDDTLLLDSVYVHPKTLERLLRGLLLGVSAADGPWSKSLRSVGLGLDSGLAVAWPCKMPASGSPSAARGAFLGGALNHKAMVRQPLRLLRSTNKTEINEKAPESIFTKTASRHVAVFTALLVRDVITVICVLSAYLRALSCFSPPNTPLQNLATFFSMAFVS